MNAANMMLDPTNPNHKSVEPIQAITPPEPVTIVDTARYYYSAAPHMNMFKPDGVKITFMHHVCMTTVKEVITYLDNELTHGNIFFSKATEEQIYAYKMKLNPVETIQVSLEATIEARLRKEYDDKLLAMMVKVQGGAPMTGITNTASLADLATQKTAG